MWSVSSTFCSAGRFGRNGIIGMPVISKPRLDAVMVHIVLLVNNWRGWIFSLIRYGWTSLLMVMYDFRRFEMLHTKPCDRSAGSSRSGLFGRAFSWEPTQSKSWRQACYVRLHFENESASVWFRPQNYFGLFCLKWLLPGCICLNQDLNRVTLVKVYSSHPEKMDCLVLWIGFMSFCSLPPPAGTASPYMRPHGGSAGLLYAQTWDWFALSRFFFSSFIQRRVPMSFFLTSLKK